MKILIVSWSVLPSNGGSSIIIENLAKNFDKDELIVLGSKKLFGNAPVERPADNPRFLYFFSEIYLFGRGYRYFTWFRKWRFRPLINEIKHIIQREQIDYVIGVYPNPFYCHAACIACRELKVPFSSYFHNTYTENTAITDPKAADIQSEIFDQSEYIFVMSDGMKRFYEEKYQLGKFKPLVHSFNAFPSRDSLKGIPGAKKDKYRLVAIGNFNESNMDATLRFAKTISDHPKYSLSLFTHVPKILLKKRGLDTHSIEYEGFVSPDKVHSVLQHYDICVLTHGFSGGYGEIEYKTIFPTRTIPLLLSGKPIIAHSPKGSFLNDFIEENKCAELVDEPSSEAIIAGLERITNDLAYQETLVEAARQTAKKFYGPNVVRQLKATLSNSMSTIP
ncbi:MAG: glycosyltransferase family 4 protein [Bacteroidota bacterium]